MIRIHILILFLGAAIFRGESQANVEWAGPDKVTCGDKGVQLGVATPCPNCCYSWTPADGLDFTDVKNPIARPKKETTYTVVVTDDKLSWKKSDQVKVELSFGEIHFIPDHLEQGTEEIVLANLKKNVGNFPTTWSLEGDNLGCSITSPPGNNNLATLTAGNQYGKLTVKVQKVGDPECFFTESLPVNNGVKDLKVIDQNNPNRFAMTGQTLYLVSNSPADWKATLEAIPNEGGFADGKPIYQPDGLGSPTPINGERIQTVEDVGTFDGKSSYYIAGEYPEYDPSVTVVREIPTDSPSGLPALVQNLYNFWQDLRQRLDFDQGDIDSPGTPPDTPPCPDPSPFSFEGSFGVNYKTSEVEKFGDPGKGEKAECTIDLAAAIGGKIYHPQFTRHFVVAGIGVCSELYGGIEYSNALHMGMTKDESLEYQDWLLNDNIQLEISLSGGVGFNATLLSGTGFNLTASGSANITLKALVDFISSNRKIVATTKLLPLTIKIEAVVVNTTNMGEFKPLFNLVSKEIVLYEGFTSTPMTLHQFSE